MSEMSHETFEFSSETRLSTFGIKQMQHGHPDLVPLTRKGRNTQFLEVFFRNHQQVAAALFS